MWTTGDVEREIKDLPALYASKPETVTDNMAVTIVSKISSIADIACGDAVKIPQILDTVTLPASLKSAVQKGVEGKLAPKEQVAAP